jgi:hypothetical protein
MCKISKKSILVSILVLQVLLSNVGFCILLVSYVLFRGSNTMLFYQYRGSKGSFGADFVFFSVVK